MNWAGWPLERVIILFVSLAFIMISIQVTMFHYRQNFHHRAMWIPVISGPIFFVAGIALTFYNMPWLATTFLVLMWIGLVNGMIGSYLHIRGVGLRVGGWALRNFLIGPPALLPAMFTAMSVLGIIAIYWR